MGVRVCVCVCVCLCVCVCVCVCVCLPCWQASNECNIRCVFVTRGFLVPLVRVCAVLLGAGVKEVQERERLGDSDRSVEQRGR